MSETYRLVYLSRNELADEEDPLAAIEEILAVSRRNNAAAGISGALMFNNGLFAQVLEGPRSVVEATFERIQCDPRHSTVEIMEFAPAEQRVFADWSMAWVGRDSAPLPAFLAAEDGNALRLLSGDRILDLLSRHLAESNELEASRRAA